MEYQNNFHKGKHGNTLAYGTPLVITIPGSPTYIAGILYKLGIFGRKKAIQIEQTGSRNNPSHDSITFEMKKYEDHRLVPMGKGKYMVIIRAALPGQGDGGFRDKFVIE